MILSGLTAIVTGGASGLGAAAARMVVDAGGRVVLLDLNVEAGMSMAARFGAAAHFAAADVTNATQMQAAVDEANVRFGKLDALINCAGIGPPQRVLGKDGPAPLEWFEKTVRVNLLGTFNAIRLAAAAMATNPPNAGGERGVIVNTASIAAFEGQIGQAAYSASKGGIVGMTLPLAREFSRVGIRVVTIAPGLFDTPLLAELPEPARIALGQSIPFPPRLGDPAEYAMLVRHVIENPMLNGEVIRLDGALRMQPK